MGDQDGQDAVGPLAGLVVADFSRVLAGPLATMVLADLGATVIKVERPGSGDDTRSWGPPYVGDMSTYYAAVNRNKRSVVLDLATDSGARAARALSARADVLVENFLPGRLDRYGLDAQTTMAASPGLVYCSISGFGAGHDLPGYDFLVQAMGGLMSITGEGASTYKVGVALVDVLAALHAVVGIQAALAERARTGLGQRVTIDLLSCLLGSLVNQLSSYLNAGIVPAAIGNRHPSVVPYETVAALDGTLALAVGNDGQFAALMRVLGMTPLASDERFATNAARVAHRGDLMTALAPAFASRGVEEWVTALTAAGVPAGPVNDVAGAVELARRLGLDPVVELTGSVGTVATARNPIGLSRTPPTYRSAPPALGADTAAVLAWLDGSPLASPDRTA